MNEWPVTSPKRRVNKVGKRESFLWFTTADEFLSRLNFLIKGIDQFLEPVEQLKSQPTIEATPTQPNTSPVKKLSAIKPATINLASIEKEPINLFVSAEKPTTSPSPRLVVPGNLNESPRKIRTGRSKYAFVPFISFLTFFELEQPVQPQNLNPQQVHLRKRTRYVFITLLFIDFPKS